MRSALHPSTWLKPSRCPFGRAGFPLFALLLAAVSAMSGTPHVAAQTSIELENVEALVRFGEQITFLATVESSIPLQTVSIVISDEASGLTQVEPVTVGADGRTEFRLDTRQNALRPFTTVTWLYRFTFPGGDFAQSQPFSVEYADDRFDWQTLDSGSLRVHWYEGDAAFGTAALETSEASLESIRELFPPDLSLPVEIFVYANVDDLRGTFTLDERAWLAGHADPALGVVMLVVEPGADQGMVMEQRIPHELMHVMIYRRLGAGYGRLPAWLGEGMATLVEIYPNSEYERVLAGAAAGDRLIPLARLCSSFPEEAGDAFLAYAEARSFTRYLHETYGSTGLLDLSAAYADGVDCERGTERLFGIPLSRLEADWRASSLGQDAFLRAFQNILPYLVLMCLVLLIPLIGAVATLRKKRKS